MRLQITLEQVEKMHVYLRAAGSQEIGGVLVGEQLSDGDFRLVDFSLQRSGGTVSHFERRPEDHEDFLESFFSRTNHEYGRFNYIGEWHSHPSFVALPSHTDIEAMQAIVEDQEQGANFAVLLIAKLDWRRRLCMSATAFRSTYSPTVVDITLLDVQPRQKKWFNRLWFRRKLVPVNRSK